MQTAANPNPNQNPNPRPNLDRFRRAHQVKYARALAEIRRGQKETHWIWFIFPQLEGTWRGEWGGGSEFSRYYALHSLAEAAAFLQDPVLGSHLEEIGQALLDLNLDMDLDREPEKGGLERVLGPVDTAKLHSSLTLFLSLPGHPAVLEQLLNRYYAGAPEERTWEVLQGQA